MLDLPTHEPGIKDNSRYYFTPPSKFVADNLFYIGCIGHFFTDSQYQFSHNILGTVPYSGGIIRNSSGTYSYIDSENSIDFTIRYLAIMPLTGSMMLITDKIYNFGSGETALIDKEKGHTYSSLGNTEFLFFMFDGNCSSLIADDLLSHGNIFSTQTMGRVQRIFREIHASAENNNETHPVIISGMIHEFLALLYRSLEVHPNSPKQKMSECVNYINDHYKEELNIELLSQLAYLSCTHFSRSFREEIGVTPYEYLLQVRFTMAKNQLATTKKSVKEIAFDVGFKSDVHFMNTFKKRFGMTPSAFRKASQQGEERIF